MRASALLSLAIALSVWLPACVGEILPPIVIPDAGADASLDSGPSPDSGAFIHDASPGEDAATQQDGGTEPDGGDVPDTG